jgi:hypothetical protein
MSAREFMTAAQVQRRRALRRVASTALQRDWEWAPNHDGWWRPDGVLVTLDSLFASTHPLDFLIEGEAVVLEGVAGEASIDADFRPLLPEGAST